jgi:hypothetical protein
MALGVIWADGVWNEAIWDNTIWAQTAATAPQLLAATVISGGDQLSLYFDKVVLIGSGGNGGFAATLSGGAATLTYDSGSGSNTLVYDISRTVAATETGTLAYTQPGDGVEEGTGEDLATFSGFNVSNGGDVRVFGINSFRILQ